MRGEELSVSTTQPGRHQSAITRRIARGSHLRCRERLPLATIIIGFRGRQGQSLCPTLRLEAVSRLRISEELRRAQVSAPVAQSGHAASYLQILLHELIRGVLELHHGTLLLCTLAHVSSPQLIARHAPYNPKHCRRSRCWPHRSLEREPFCPVQPVGVESFCVTTWQKCHETNNAHQRPPTCSPLH